MADNEKELDNSLHGNDWEVPKTVAHEEGDEQIPRGNEWEVVSLTASTYAAAPGPRGSESIHEERGTGVSEYDEAETSRALFMSQHFVFPPSEHENLPVDPFIENLKGDKAEEDVLTNVLKEGKSASKEEEDWKIGLDVPEEFPGIQVFDEKGTTKLSIHDPGFDEAVSLHGLNVDSIGQDVYASAKFSSFHSDSAIGGSVAYDEILSDPVEESQQEADSSSLIPHSPKSGNKDLDDSELPCGAWWNRRISSLCAQAKEKGTFWSIFVAAAVMGLVLLGQRWQQERWQVLQHRWQVTVGDENSGRFLFRLKDIIIGGSRRGAYITSTSTEL